LAKNDTFKNLFCEIFQRLLYRLEQLK